MASTVLVQRLAFFLMTLGAVACGSGDDGSTNTGNGSSSSVAQAAGSHNAGENCLSSGCHDGSNSGTPEFTVGGTIFKSGGAGQSDATVRLYIHNTNTLVAELETDSSGNFYTTEAVQGLSDGSGMLVSGVDVEVEGPSGGLHNMPGLITSGACNGCHGNGNSDVVVN